jgi:hypothetical protein
VSSYEELADFSGGAEKRGGFNAACIAGSGQSPADSWRSEKLTSDQDIGGAYC